MKFKKYTTESDISFTLGILPTIELLKSKPEVVIKVIFSQKAKNHKEFESLQRLVAKYHILIEQDDFLVEKYAQKANTSVVGIFRKYKMKLENDQNHILLYRPADIGNLGMIMRSGLAFDIANIGIISPGVDCFHPNAIRASMGALFGCNVEYFESLEKYRSRYQNKICVFDIKGTVNLQDLKVEKPFTFLFGSEGDGVPDELSKGAVLTKIPYNSAKVESLNLANSVSIATGYVYFDNK